MQSNLNAEASAPISGISTQGTTPTTSQPAADNSRGPELQGNNTTEKKPLDMWTQVDLVRNAMDRKHDRNFKEWGHTTLAKLLDYQAEDGASMDTYITFFRDLLLFIAKPEISQVFNQSVPDGLERVQNLSGFFIDLLGHTDYDQYVAYHRMYDNYKKDDSSVFLVYAEDYLTSDDLHRVRVAHGEEEETPAPLTAAAQDSDAYLVALLDYYFPNVEWKADKTTIATHEKMKWFLKFQEEKRIKEEGQTPEDKKAEEVRRQIQYQTESGFYLNMGSLPKITPKTSHAASVLAEVKSQSAGDPLLANAVRMVEEHEKKHRAAPAKKPASKKPAAPTKKPASKPTSKKKKA